MKSETLELRFEPDDVSFAVADRAEDRPPALVILISADAEADSASAEAVMAVRAKRPGEAAGPSVIGEVNVEARGKLRVDLATDEVRFEHLRRLLESPFSYEGEFTLHLAQAIDFNALDQAGVQIVAYDFMMHRED
jgi:hypothetical protein